MSNIGEGDILSREWFQRDTVRVARELIGCILVVRHDARTELRVRIVETEAYLAEGDEACHAAVRRTPRNTVMFDDGGVLYVYRIYGVHYCTNIVTEQQSRGCAVLLRAAEAVQGHEYMRDYRAGVDDAQLLNGPGNLSRAMNFGMDHNGLSCSSTSIHVLKFSPKTRVAVSTRIGISQSKDLPLRFFEEGCPSVSAHKRSIGT